VPLRTEAAGCCCWLPAAFLLRRGLLDLSPNARSEPTACPHSSRGGGVGFVLVSLPSGAFRWFRCSGCAAPGAVGLLDDGLNLPAALRLRKLSWPTAIALVLAVGRTDCRPTCMSADCP